MAIEHEKATARPLIIHGSWITRKIRQGETFVECSTLTKEIEAMIRDGHARLEGNTEDGLVMFVPCIGYESTEIRDEPTRMDITGRQWAECEAPEIPWDHGTSGDRSWRKLLGLAAAGGARSLQEGLLQAVLLQYVHDVAGGLGNRTRNSLASLVKSGGSQTDPLLYDRDDDVPQDLGALVSADLVGQGTSENGRTLWPTDLGRAVHWAMGNR